MNEMSEFWSWWIIILTVGNIAACVWLIRWTMKKRVNEASEGDVTGHKWDGLEEFNNPLPRWWLWLFYGTIIFAVAYLALYPGLGSYKGMLGWSSFGQYDKEIEQADKEFAPIFAAFAKSDVATLSKNPEATAVGQRLFLNYCSQCHGSAATGTTGFPNLTDNAWLWGGSPEQITASITNGRQGAMPAWKPILGEDGVKAAAAYVQKLNNRPVDAQLASKGEKIFKTNCVACHGPEAKGNPMLGAPNLTDADWLYGGSAGAITKTIANGRNGQMPAHGKFLGKDKIHVLSAFVYSLSNK